MSLLSLGWDEHFARQFQTHSAHALVPARVTLEHKHVYVLHSAYGELSAGCTGQLLHSAASRADLPAVGDWVAVRVRPGKADLDAHGRRHADIHAVLPRRTTFSRTAVGGAGGEQIVAANVDIALLVTALDHNYNLRRIERYLAAAWESGAQPVVVLNKADLHPDPTSALVEVSTVAIGAPVVAVSAARDDGWSALTPWLVPGRTLALFGSSGVGKSTLINRILGEERQDTRTLSDAVGKGRHTTTRRELIVAPSGVLVIDTPGMRELQLWAVDDEALGTTFADVTALLSRCRFNDCSHQTEPGCAVQSALTDGTLTPERWESFEKLRREQAFAARKGNSQLARETRNHWRKINQSRRRERRFDENQER